MKRTPLVKKNAARLVTYGEHIIHVLDNPADSPQGAFIGDYLALRGSQSIYRKDTDGFWEMVHRNTSVYQDVKVRLYGEGIDLWAGDDS